MNISNVPNLADKALSIYKNRANNRTNVYYTETIVYICFVC